MEVHNETKTHKIQLELVDSEMQNLPSIQVCLTFETPTLKYSNESIWLTIQDLDTFQNSVEELLNNNTGKTNLKSMSPGELNLKIENNDNLGNFIISLNCSQITDLSNNFKQSISSQFEVQGYSLKQIITGISELKNVC